MTKSLHAAKEELSAFVDKDTILLGHSLENDLRALGIVHKRVIDVSQLFASKTGRRHSLKELALTYANLHIQAVGAAD